MLESGPTPAVHGVVRWRLIDLAQWIFEESRITIAKQTLSRELRSMGVASAVGHSVRRVLSCHRATNRPAVPSGFELAPGPAASTINQKLRKGFLVLRISQCIP
jgi:hypothetical protein